MNVGIIIEDAGLSDIDFTHINEGNPGVGGTLYEELLLAYTLVHNSSISVFLYVSNVTNIYLDGVEVICKSELAEILVDAENKALDVLLFCTGKSLKWYETLSQHNVKSIAWAHGFINYYELKKINKTTQIKRVVFVGKNMYHSYIADDIIEKSIYIYNMFNPKYSIKRDTYKHDICYLGALNRYKGFHILAEAWPKVISIVPDAQLYVCGKGNLYNRNSKLGKYQIAESGYEKSFIKYLIDDSGELIPSVHFLGNVGKEKSELISKMCAGVVNPTAITETFCISAIEINACGVPVCTRGAYGLLDTVIDNQTGLFSNNANELADNLIKLLTDNDLNGRLSKSALENVLKFTPDRLIKNWIELFSDVYSDKKAKLPNIGEISTDIPELKKFLYKMRIQKGFKFIPSFIRFEYFFKDMGRVFFRDIVYHYTKKGY